MRNITLFVAAIIFIFTQTVYAQQIIPPVQTSGSGGGPLVDLGTSTTSTNPQASGHANTGFFTADGVSTVDVSAGGIEAMRWTTQVGGVNYINVLPGTAGNSASIQATGTDTNVNLSLRTKGTGAVHLAPGLVKQMEVDYTASAVDYLTITGSATAATGIPTIGVAGTDTNISINMTPQGSGNLNLTLGGYALNGKAAVTSSVTALTPGTTVSWNVATSPNATLTPAQNFTLSNPTNIAAGIIYNIKVTQPASGGPWTITWGTSYQFPGGASAGDFVLSTAANAVDIITCESFDGSTLQCSGLNAFAH